MKIRIIQEARYGRALERLTDDEQYLAQQLVGALRFGRKTPGMHEEKLKTENCEKVYSYRVNDDIRLIAVRWRPSELILIDIGHHKPVYERVARMRFVAGTDSSLPIIEESVRLVKQMPVVVTTDRPNAYGLKAVSDADLTALGVPQGAIRDIRLVDSEDKLLEVAARLSLPDDVACALIDVAADPSCVGDVEKSLRRKSAQSILKNDVNSRSHYVLLTDELEDQFYKGELENWQVYLHPDQQRAVDVDAAGPIARRRWTRRSRAPSLNRKSVFFTCRS